MPCLSVFFCFLCLPTQTEALSEGSEYLAQAAFTNVK